MIILLRFNILMQLRWKFLSFYSKWVYTPNCSKVLLLLKRAVPKDFWQRRYLVDCTVYLFV